MGTKKHTKWIESSDLYAIPVTAVPECGWLLGHLMKQDGIQRASQLYEQVESKIGGWSLGLRIGE
jgi:hypothetical protein